MRKGLSMGFLLAAVLFAKESGGQTEAVSEQALPLRSWHRPSFYWLVSGQHSSLRALGYSAWPSDGRNARESSRGMDSGAMRGIAHFKLKNESGYARREAK